MEELTGGTFNDYQRAECSGRWLSTPIVNSPQSAILGMHKIQDPRRSWIDGQVVVRPHDVHRL